MRWSQTFTVVDCHAEGEIGKVVTGGVFDVPGRTMFDKMRHLAEHRDGLRKFVLFEPRGTVNHNANIILPTNNPEAAMGFVILESTEYPAMSGSNTICVATVLLETGILPMKEPVTELVLEAPGGLIKVTCDCKDGKVRQVKFTNQPAFAYHLDKVVEVEGLGSLKVDVAYGGMTYVHVDATALGLGLTRDEARDLCGLGQRIKTAAAAQLEVSHPENPLIPGITQTQFMGPFRREGGRLTAKNTVIVSPGRNDRSPCGTGTCARLAVMHAKGQIKPGEVFDHESLIGTHFISEIVGTTKVGRYPAVIPTVAGQAWITAISQFGYDPTDPFPEGFTLSDVWLKAL
ncbi:MAG TPA: proline racemase family protein [Hypericibacter adhaerens]|jgi:proline racemase|uniref:proline racemase family protein n=1 Tax=Hypericibacter adhaerens TaxID=2602016 RepID=UPI002B89486F|nr:proline racemase family protein [Hypericibacter adhaerens]HWA45406.1 proline racemase family protein [Hypericibacter adhaerens]